MPELVALLHVPERRSERPPGYADHLSADADAAGVEGLDRHLVAFAHLSHYAGRGQLAAVEDQFARARRADAELVFLLADREPAAVALDHERGDPFVALREVGVREYHEQPRFGPVGDPQLDRKSTRLNSSHSQISYAVFCLKK